MLARLWWKEYRAFGPVWLVLALAAGGAQWLLLTLSPNEFRSGALTLVALGWVVLYAFTAGAAAFAGEREAKTLAFLDALPVDRQVLWLGKASFVLASTLGLALAFAGLAALGTEVRTVNSSFQYASIVRVFGVLLFEAVAWSLFFSSITGNPLLAGIMAVLGLAASSSFIESATATARYRAVDFDLVSTSALPVRLLIALLVLLASGLVMAWRPGARRIRTQRRSEPARQAVALSGSSPNRSLIWLTAREGRTTWLVAAALALFVSTGLGWYPSGEPVTMVVVLATLTCLVAGVGVFGTADAPGSRRFLASHGVGPASAWWRKVLTSGGVLGAIFGASLYSDWTGPSVPLPYTGRDQEFHERTIILLGLALLDAFAVGLVCGMAITRRVTAVTLGAVGVIAIVPLSVLLVVAQMIPTWSVFLVPVALLAASRAWAADWLFEREGARPWIKLGAWIVIPFLLLGSSYVSYRAYGVADVGPRYAEGDLLHQPGQDAAFLYRGAGEVIRPPADGPGQFTQRVDDAIRHGWDGAPTDVTNWWKANAAALGLARRTSTLPIARFETSFTYGPADVALENARVLSDLLGLDARERLAVGDLAGAWDDALALLRMANQFAGNVPTLAMVNQATDIHHRGVGLAFAALDDPRVSLEFANKILADLKALPSLPNLAGAVKVEAAIIDRSLNLSGQDLATLLLSPSGQLSVGESVRFARIEAPPWERERARRVCRKIIDADLRAVALEPSARGALLSSLPPDGFASRLARMLLPNFGAPLNRLDRETVGRRALIQVAALRSWKLAHDGKDAEALQLLVPSLLASLPLDPYSYQPFLYRRSDGLAIVPPIEPDNLSVNVDRETRPGQFLLYSVGPDRTDNRGMRIYNFVNQGTGDYTYAIP
jgi:hypothetical protein